jgi:phage terminase small subunit
MARQRNPKRDEAHRLYDDSGGKIKLTDLAEKLDVPASRVRKWKSEDKWERSDSKQKERSDSKRENKHIKKKLLESVENNDELTDKQRLFCLFYVSSHNGLQSYLKAYECSKPVAMVEAYRLLKNPRIAAEIKRLKALMSTELDIGPNDMIRYCLKIVGADIGDYLQFGREEIETDKGIYAFNRVKLNESDALDTSIVDEVKQGKDGVTIKMADKKWAWDKLEKYLGWGKDADEQQLRLDKLRAEVDAIKSKNSSDDDISGPLIIKPVYGRGDTDG